MKGVFAALFFIAGLTDMTTHHCPTGCLARSDSPKRLTIAAGPTLFQNKAGENELFLRYEFGRKYGPFQPIAALSVATSEDIWVGLGAAWTATIGKRDQLFVELSFMPGLYALGDGPNLGSPLEFRSALVFGYEFYNGTRLALSYDHRSNGELAKLNPGLETVALRYSIPIR